MAVYTSSEKLHIPFVEYLKSIPETFGIHVSEEPAFDLVRRDKNIELRRYLPQLRASYVVSNLPFNTFRDVAFKKLAGYIFGNNRDQKNIAMTTPVLHQQTNGDHWKMSFILPRMFNLSNAPVPLDADIRLEQIPAFDAAAIQFSGNNTLEKDKENQEELQKWLSAQNEIAIIGSFMIAQYDKPTAITFLKRNEIIVPIAYKSLMS